MTAQQPSSPAAQQSSTLDDFFIWLESEIEQAAYGAVYRKCKAQHIDSPAAARIALAAAAAALAAYRAEQQPREQPSSPESSPAA